MQYNKSALTFLEQADLLLRRGMTGDRQLMESYLAMTNYFKLSAYWADRISTKGRFIQGTKFDDIVARYEFDHTLRNVVLDAIGRVEVAMKPATRIYSA